MSGRGLKNVPVVPMLLVTLLYLYGFTILGRDNLSRANPNPAETSYKEDFNGDGNISVADAIALLLLGRDDPGNSVADYNGDGKYSITDVIKLLLNIRDGNLTPVADTTAVDTTISDTTATDTTSSNQTYTIQGMVYCAAQSVGNVQILLDGDMQASTFTTGSGMYTFLVPNGQYTIIPVEISGYGFNPISRSIRVSGSDIYNQDFFFFGWESLPGNN